MSLQPEFLCASLGVWSALGGRKVAARDALDLADAPIVWIGGAATDEVVREKFSGINCYAAVVEDVAAPSRSSPWTTSCGQYLCSPRTMWRPGEGVFG